MTALLDYAVITMPKISPVEALLPRFTALVDGGRKQVRFGYRGNVRGKCFFGYNDFALRYMISMTGEAATDVLSAIPRQLDDYISVARIDVQETYIADDAVDEVINITPSPRYSSRRLIGLNGDRGCTLYVGAPSSLLMARVYNKSAESNLFPDGGGEYVRVEFLLRDRYADRAWAKARGGLLDDVFVSLTDKMFLSGSAERIKQKASVSSAGGFSVSSKDEEDEVQRRIRWLSTLVVPSLNKLIAKYPNAQEQVWKELAMVSREESQG